MTNCVLVIIQNNKYIVVFDGTYKHFVYLITHETQRNVFYKNHIIKTVHHNTFNPYPVEVENMVSS